MGKKNDRKNQNPDERQDESTVIPFSGAMTAALDPDDVTGLGEDLSAQKSLRFNVLLIGEDPKQTELYTELVREMVECHVDVMSRVESSFDWIIQSNYQLIVVDSPQEGLSLLEKIKRFSPGTSVILVSERASVEHAVAAIRMGAEDYLKKPFGLESFRLAVKRTLDRKKVFGGDAGASNFLNLLNACQMISASLEQEKIFGIVRSYLARELQSDYSAIYVLDADGNPKRLDEPSSGERKQKAMEEILDIALYASHPLSRMVESHEEYRFIERSQLSPALFAYRFRCSASVEYFCVCLSPERPASMDSFESRLRMLSAQLEVTGKNIDQYQGVQDLAYMDDATGLYNTRYLHYILDREIIQAEESGKSFAILFIDADKFKGVNDAHGHLVGTKLLNELGRQLKDYVRETDTVFRYGGDEFVAVLSGCDLTTAEVVAERIRKSVEERKFLEDEGLNIHFTVSIGVALFPDHATSKEDVIEASDHAMYTAKKTTRNKVFIAELKDMPSRAQLKAQTKKKTSGK